VFKPYVNILKRETLGNYLSDVGFKVELEWDRKEAGCVYHPQETSRLIEIHITRLSLLQRTKLSHRIEANIVLPTATSLVADKDSDLEFGLKAQQHSQRASVMS